MKQNIVVKLIRMTVFVLVGLFYLFFLSGSIYEAVVFPQFPQNVTLAQAVEMDLKNRPDFLVFDQTLYISITDAVWQCASVKQTGYESFFLDRRRTDAVFTDSAKTAVVFIQVDGFFNCQELKEKEISGELQRTKARPVTYQSDTNGLTTIEKTSQVLTYYFSPHKTPLEARLLPLFFLLIPFVIWGIVKYWKRL